MVKNMSTADSIPTSSVSRTPDFEPSSKIPGQVQIARRRSRNVVGNHLKCKTCLSSDAWISEEEGMKWVNCPTCGNHYRLKGQHLKPAEGEDTGEFISEHFGRAIGKL